MPEKAFLFYHAHSSMAFLLSRHAAEFIEGWAFLRLRHALEQLQGGLHDQWKTGWNCGSVEVQMFVWILCAPHLRGSIPIPISSASKLVKVPGTFTQEKGLHQGVEKTEE